MQLRSHEEKELTMMMMNCSGPMMIAMGAVALLIVIALLLTVAALIKYLRSGPS